MYYYLKQSLRIDDLLKEGLRLLSSSALKTVIVLLRIDDLLKEGLRPTWACITSSLKPSESMIY